MHVIMRLDDILINGRNETEHLKNLEVVLKQLHYARLRLLRNKFMATEVVFCGHKVTAEGVTLVKANMQAIIEA